MTSPDLIGTTEVAEILGKSIPTVKRMAKDGRLPFAMQMHGATGAYLFDRSVIEERKGVDSQANVGSGVTS